MVRIIRDGIIGEIRSIQAAFSFSSGYDPRSRLWNPALGGGGILDVGCYPVSLARLVAGAASGRDFLDPVKVTGTARMSASGIDEVAVGCLEFPGGIVAEVATGVGVQMDNVARIYGTKGWILLPSPWSMKGAGTYRILVHRQGANEPEEVTGTADRSSYAYEADAVTEGIERRRAAPPAMTPDDTLGNMRACDRWREAIGLTYDLEKPDNVTTVHNRPIAIRKEARMELGRLAGLEKPVSRLVLGVMGHGPTAMALMDEFFEQGGNAFDTAYVYGGGSSDKTLGAWVRQRGVRNQVVILAKGAHTPHCNPKALGDQLLESLDRLQTDHADLYVMHRDNPDVPVGEFVDALNDHVKAGRIRVFGGSNWTIDRFDAANAYAKERGLQGFGVLSNNFSLARMVEAPWSGCLDCKDGAWRPWLEKTRTPVFAWSSQARGFFARGPVLVRGRQLQAARAGA
jgi:aryl-alcohol dehydrogenase-like predicted oxidoreductase